MKTVFRKHKRRHAKHGTPAPRTLHPAPPLPRSANPLFRAAYFGEWLQFVPLKIY